MKLTDHESFGVFLITAMLSMGIIGLKNTISVIIFNQLVLFIFYIATLKDISEMSKKGYLLLIISAIIWTIATCYISYTIIPESGIFEAVLLILNVLELGIAYKIMIGRIK